MNIVINKELASFFPPLAFDQKLRLEQALTKYGQEDLIKIGHFGDQTDATEHFIIDGHNRYDILTKAGKKPLFDEFSVEFKDLDDAKIWMIEHQLGRRELEPYARAEYAMKLQGMIESRQGRRTDLTLLSRDSEVETPFKQAATSAGLGEATYAKAKYIAEHADEETKAALRRGEAHIKPVYESLTKPKDDIEEDPLDEPMKIIYKYVHLIEKEINNYDEGQMNRIKALAEYIFSIYQNAGGEI